MISRRSSLLVIFFLSVASTGVLVIVHLLSHNDTNAPQVQVDGWEINIVRNTSHYLKSLEPVMIPHDFCKPTFLLILVNAKPSNFKLRRLIRRTWGEKNYLSRFNAAVYFVMGQSDESTKYELQEEIALFADVVQAGFVEGYMNLTLKTIAMVKLAVDCSQARFVIKIDDDTFSNVAAIVKYLKEKVIVNGSRELLQGFKTCDALPEREPSSKYYAPRYMFPSDEYPSFLNGPAYIMSMEVAHKLYHSALDTPLFHMEDVFLTGICAVNARVRLTHHVGHYKFFWIVERLPSCSVFFTIHNAAAQFEQLQLRVEVEEDICAAGNGARAPLSALGWLWTSVLRIDTAKYHYRSWCY